MKKKIFICSLLAIVLCFSMIVGATFALFTSESKVNIAVTSGKVEVVASVEDVKTYSKDVLQAKGTFENGGTAVYDDKLNELALNLITPGDKVELTIKMVNNSNVAIMYRTIVDATNDNGLYNGLNIKVNDEEFVGFACSNWQNSFTEEEIKIVIELPYESGNEYQDKNTVITFLVEAVQGNADEIYNGLNIDENGNYVINNEIDLKNFSSLVNSGNSFEGETVVLGANIDLQNKPFIPVGNKDAIFLGDFDGNGYTIKNFSAYNNDGAGLFGYAGKAGKYVTIKNVTLENVSINTNHYAAAVVGKLWGSVDNATVKKCFVNVTPDGSIGAWDNGDKAGCVVGWMDNGVVSNCNVSNCQVTAYRDLGGIVGCVINEGRTTKVIDNKVTDVTLSYDDSGKVYKSPQANMGAVYGRLVNGSKIEVANNTVANVTMENKTVYHVSTVDELLNAVNNCSYIVLLNDLEVSSQSLIVSSDLVLDLSGNTLSFVNSSDACIKVNSGAKLTVLGKGIVKSDSLNNDLFKVVDGSTLELNENDYQMDGEATSYLISAYDNSQVLLQNGKYYGSLETPLFNPDNVNNFSVYGGTYQNTNPAYGKNNDHSYDSTQNMLANGYYSYNIGDVNGDGTTWYEVRQGLEEDKVSVNGEVFDTLNDAVLNGSLYKVNNEAVIEISGVVYLNNNSNKGEKGLDLGTINGALATKVTIKGTSEDAKLIMNGWYAESLKAVNTVLCLADLTLVDERDQTSNAEARAWEFYYIMPVCNELICNNVVFDGEGVRLGSVKKSTFDSCVFNSTQSGHYGLWIGSSGYPAYANYTDVVEEVYVSNCTFTGYRGVKILGKDDIIEVVDSTFDLTEKPGVCIDSFESNDITFDRNLYLNETKRVECEGGIEYKFNGYTYNEDLD